MRIESFNDYNFTGMKLPMITVYRHPSDFPQSFVARLFDLNVYQADYILKDTLDEIREAIPLTFSRLLRHPSDDPVIVEVWV